MFFGLKSFASGEEQYNLQSKVRMASIFITEELRYAYSVQIIDSSNFAIPNEVTDELNYIYIKNNKLYHKNKDNNVAREIPMTTSDNVNINLIVNTTNTNGMINFKVIGTDGESTYDIVTDVSVLNLKSSIKKEGVSNSTSSYGVVYEKVDPDEVTSLRVVPNLIREDHDFPSDFRLTLIKEELIEFEEEYFSLGGAFKSMTIDEIEIDNNVVVLTIDGELDEIEKGFASITVKGTALKGGNDLTATIEVRSLRTEPPKANPLPGKVKKNQEIRLSSETIEAEIYFTMDGTDIDLAEPNHKYNPTLDINSRNVPVVEEDVTIKAMATKEGLGDSLIETFEYYIYPFIQSVSRVATANKFTITLTEEVIFDGSPLYNADGKPYYLNDSGFKVYYLQSIENKRYIDVEKVLLQDSYSIIIETKNIPGGSGEVFFIEYDQKSGYEIRSTSTNRLLEKTTISTH
ncbi:hypothetical protein F9B85_11500 [Heliorestis acidaminivorans]|uniref:GH29D-like beta-sandwich domain-containing protein n=1 Tax=Heliorestis acidaminivorans TaxID=553427 RepID=A0A6I0ES72_9FIRM|nr:chitobiase/beta-hexosaminidase C-terminal domain-containing protein [Heliorestis acidaminivorans]KAB2951651.1 hypothetical protein F9B85_11500 [Heliorestis acidaminivorans]